MSKVAVVTDSTANIPEELLSDYPISIIPLNVIWGEEVFLDGIDIKPDEFYARLKTSKTLPTTSQPSPQAFCDVYSDLMEKDYDIISIHISAKLSGTVHSALQARTDLDPVKIEVVDSQVTSMALGFPVIAVAKAAVEGATLAECKALAERSILQTNVIFTVSTLEYLHRGGRIGGASAFLGTALDLKPVLNLQDGRIEPIERVRTFNKAVDRIIENFKKQVEKVTPLHIAAIHAVCIGDAKSLLEKVRASFGISEIDTAVISEISPVIGTHTGPGALGISYMAGI